MKYQGGKTRISKDICLLMSAWRGEGQCYVEPFVGGGSIIQRMSNPRIGSDISPHLIDAMLLIRDRANDLPSSNKEITKEFFLFLKRGGEHWAKNWIGYIASYGAKFFDSWATGKGSDYILEGKNSAVRQSPLLKGVDFRCCRYNEVVIPDGSLIYCDPPYYKTRQDGYRMKESFDHEAFWDWCRLKVKEGHLVFVSEYSAPDDFVCIYSKKQKTCLDSARKSGKDCVEKLFIHRDQSSCLL